MSFYISGVGTAVPHELIAQDDAARIAVELTAAVTGHSAAIQTLYRRAGVKKRHSALLCSSTNGHPATQSFFSAAANSDDRGPTTDERMRQYEASALDLAERAACDALAASGSGADDIEHLVTVSCTGFSARGSTWAWLSG